MTILPAVLADRTVIGAYRCAPASESIRSRYEPSGQPSVGMVSDGPHLASTVLVGWFSVGDRCRWPGVIAELHTRRAWSPPYQPIRNACTWKDRAVVEAYSVIVSPGSTLAWSV